MLWWLYSNVLNRFFYPFGFTSIVRLTGNDGLIVTDFALVPGRLHCQMVLVLTNVTDRVIPDAEIQVVFYGKDGGIIATKKDGHDAILSGSSAVTQSIIYDKGVEQYATVEVTIDTKKYDNSYVNHAEKLGIVENTSGGKVFLQITNNDTVAIAEIEIVTVFYKGGQIVGASEEETFDLGAGDKAVLEFYGVDSADEYKVFINQAHTWW